MEKEPLYRKVNTRTRGVNHKNEPSYAQQRHSKALAAKEHQRGSMHSGKRLGLDYTPLFRFLLSRVGQPWDPVFSEAKSRLDRQEPIFWQVALHEHQQQDYVRLGHCAFYSGLYVDAQGLLQKVNPDLHAATMSPDCPCCTHTLNGVPFGLAYER
ncbi:hypothetical protein J4P02_25790 [Pseudomonas sp. NFXW11]|uniref:hypothetical protein n=1 Tax=Pseudomonas sp. NFXW11 TaxID=2819531 RepID=UPI003CEA7410